MDPVYLVELIIRETSAVVTDGRPNVRIGVGVRDIVVRDAPPVCRDDEGLERSLNAVSL